MGVKNTSPSTLVSARRRIRPIGLIRSGSGERRIPLEVAGEKQARAWSVFVNVDGQNGRSVCPLPHSQLSNVRVNRDLVEALDVRSCRDRYEEIKDQLDSDEQALLQSLLLHISGGRLKNSSLWDMIRSHALMGHSTENFEEVWLMYKLREGQSVLAKKMFEDAAEHGLDYSFNTPIQAIEDGNNVVTVTGNDGRKYRARRVINTIPLNVLHTIRFDPPLSARRQEAIEIGHVNHMTKVHAEVEGKMASWRGCTYPGQLLYAYGDGFLPNGNTHVVAFGADERPSFVPEKHPEKVVEALNRFHPMDVKRLVCQPWHIRWVFLLMKKVFHDWNTDPWSQAGPAWWQPGYLKEYQEELQSRHGNVFFASADWAHGWRAAIDGALEQGFLNAVEVMRELRKIDSAQRAIVSPQRGVVYQPRREARL